jgi:hypothetical protein
MTAHKRQLAGVRVGLSISDGEDSSAMGFPISEVNRTVLRIVAALLGQGAKLGFGQDWRDDGVMESVHAFAERFHLVARGEQEEPPLWNLVAWPDRPSLSQVDRERLKHTLRIDSAGLPPSLSHLIAANHAPPLAKYLRARGLTHLRRKLTGLCDVRICLGGRTTNYAGRYPGILEEAYFAVEAKQPLFLVGLLGGATRKLISVLTDNARELAFSRNENIENLFQAPPTREERPENPEDLRCSVENLLGIFSKLGIEGLSRLNWLSTAENIRLFYTQATEEAIDLVLTGIGRYVANRR